MFHREANLNRGGRDDPDDFAQLVANGPKPDHRPRGEGKAVALFYHKRLAVKAKAQGSADHQTAFPALGVGIRLPRIGTGLHQKSQHLDLWLGIRGKQLLAQTAVVI